MTSRLTATFAALKKEQRAALIPFIMAGDPNEAVSREILEVLPQAGADIIEIGVPFSDPMADGPVIQAAGQRALAHGMKLARVLTIVSEFRNRNSTTPIVLMGYYNPFYRYGAEKFCADAKRAGVDGLIIVDLPPEEEAEFKPHADKHGIALIRLIAPTSVPERLNALLHSTRGFVYYISVTGITGAKSANMDELEEKVKIIRTASALPVAIGFGVKTPEQAAAMGKQADAVVVGSALVDIIAKAKEPAKEAAAFVKNLRQALGAA